MNPLVCINAVLDFCLQMKENCANGQNEPITKIEKVTLLKGQVKPSDDQQDPVNKPAVLPVLLRFMHSYSVIVLLNLEVQLK